MKVSADTPGAVQKLTQVNWEQVCKLWHELSLDGQLWTDAPSATLLGPDSLTVEGVDRIVTTAAGFQTSLDARGLGSRLDWKTLVRLVEVAQTANDHRVTRLGKIDLTGTYILVVRQSERREWLGRS